MSALEKHTDFEGNLMKVVFENKDFLVINKPPGISIHCGRGASDINNAAEVGVIEQLRQQLGDRSLFPVHRLDRVTSGLLLVAKGERSTSELSQLFQNRTIQKYYLALATKKPKKKQGTIKGDMKSARNGAWMLVKDCENPAVTQFFSHGLGDGVRCFFVKPLTGKTHQIRVALKSLGAPILGDVKYGGSSSDRAYLHAYGLDFQFRGQDFSFRCVPEVGAYFLWEGFQEFIENSKDPVEFSWPNVTL